jgi:hypothetical protein
MDISVTSEGDLIAPAGAVSEAHLIVVRRTTGVIEPLSRIAGPARYPAISPDGKRLAFSRRQWGSWHLVVRELATGVEQQLTHAHATRPYHRGKTATNCCMQPIAEEGSASALSLELICRIKRDGKR